MNPDRKDTQIKPVLDTIPEGRLAVVPLRSISEVGRKVDEYLAEWRRERVLTGVVANENGYFRDSYIINTDTPRFGSGEAKGVIRESIRADDVYILVDVMNYGLTYRIGDFDNVMGPDDHFQDLKRIIGAIGNKAIRVTVIMPYLYEGRQLLTYGQESLDCANALQELVAMGVDNIITFDTHDPRVGNAIPLAGFENFVPTYQFIKNLIRAVPDIKIDRDHLMVISPDEAGMSRAIYLANVLRTEMGTFYKKRDYTTIEDGVNPIMSYEFLGSEVEGKDIIIVDDMISSGKAVLKTASLLKKRKARRIFICATFAILTGGTAPFDKAYKEGDFDLLITTNLVYQPEELLSRKYYVSCDMSKFIALVIDTLNHDCSLSSLLDPVDRITKVLNKHAKGKPV